MISNFILTFLDTKRTPVSTTQTKLFNPIVSSEKPTLLERNLLQNRSNKIERVVQKILQNIY